MRIFLYDVQKPEKEFLIAFMVTETYLVRKYKDEYSLCLESFSKLPISIPERLFKTLTAKPVVELNLYLKLLSHKYITIAFSESSF